MEASGMGPLDLCPLHLFPQPGEVTERLFLNPNGVQAPKFKRDLRNTAQCWKFLNPDNCRGYLQRVIELDALDLGLRVLDCEPAAPSENIFEPSQFSLGKQKNV
jgi:hypothetical protein